MTDMPTDVSMLRRGRVYRTRDFLQWTTNPSRLARRLVAEGELKPLAHGLFVHPEEGRFGVVPPTDEAIMQAFIGGPFVLTGPEQWNALGLGTQACGDQPAMLAEGQREPTRLRAPPGATSSF